VIVMTTEQWTLSLNGQDWRYWAKTINGCKVQVTEHLGFPGRYWIKCYTRPARHREIEAVDLDGAKRIAEEWMEEFV